MPIPLIVLGAVLLLLAALLALRVRLLLVLDEGVRLELRVLCLRLRLYPRRKRINPRRYTPRALARRQAKAERKAAKKAAKKAKKQKKSVGGSHAVGPAPKKRTLTENIRLIRALLAVLTRHTQKHLRLHAARLHIRVATGDAAKTAIAYGAVSQSLAYLLSALDRVARVKAVQPDVCVEADFLGERSKADVKLLLSLRVWGALATLFGVALSYLRTNRGLKVSRRKKTAARQASQKGT